MQNVDLRNKNYIQFVLKNKSGARRGKIIFDFFFNLDFFWSSFSLLNITESKLVKAHFTTHRSSIPTGSIIY